ncbi:MAG: ubiquitin-like protein UBact [Armatimonadetes bacterium]|nr:ubiquitin-like protein UBact [Armatimonadota bacterium]MBS1703881.1 ubiquitin-like protein UBact [Armatimonadota bacterium]MBS1726258.1 ubiquitin-like protein UBact [Armatimonadota bacterium]
MLQFEQPQRQKSPVPERKQGDDSGPKSPDITKPEGGNELLRRLKKVDPDQAKKYRQRSGQ